MGGVSSYITSVTQRFQSPQEQLLTLLKQKNFDDFEKLFKSNDIDVNYFYKDPDNGTLLDIACRSAGNVKFVQFLIKNGANMNEFNDFTGKVPIHELVDTSDMDMLRTFLNYDSTSINFRTRPSLGCPGRIRRKRGDDMMKHFST